MLVKFGILPLMYPSLSARRAWIEIPAGCWRDARRVVALRKESVDRNDNGNAVAVSDLESLSARRAWIEIRPLIHHQSANRVALRKESVDRNKNHIIFYHSLNRRSPQGERG